MTRRLLLTTLGFLFGALPALSLHALTIRTNGGSGEQPPTLFYDPQSPNPTTIEIELFNETTSIVETVVLWQVHLEILAGDQATGQVEIVSFDAAETPFLDSPSPTVGPDSSLPATEVTLLAADLPLPPDLPGKEVLPNTSVDLVSIDIGISPETRGEFYLVLGEFEPIAGSAWSSLFPPPNPFANEPSVSGPNEIVLAKLVYPVPEPSTAFLCGLTVVLLSVFWRTA